MAYSTGQDRLKKAVARASALGKPFRLTQAETIESMVELWNASPVEAHRKAIEAQLKRQHSLETPAEVATPAPAPAPAASAA
jgi:hypothetical protein